MTEVICGIDPSTSTGVCIMEDGKPIHVELLKIKPKGWESGRAYAYFADSLWAMFVSFGVQAFAVETKIIMGGVPSNAHTHDLATVLFGRCQELASRLNIEMTGVAVQSWRSTFLGKTVAPKAPDPPDNILATRKAEWQRSWRSKWWKQQAIDACERRGIKVPNHDCAEAVGLAVHLYKLRHPLGLAGANDLFDLPETKPVRTTLTLPQAKTEAEKVFASFNAESAE